MMAHLFASSLCGLKADSLERNCDRASSWEACKAFECIGDNTPAVGF